MYRNSFYFRTRTSNSLHLVITVKWRLNGKKSSYSLNVKELLARNRRDIWNLSDCNFNYYHWKIVILPKNIFTIYERFLGVCEINETISRFLTMVLHQQFLTTFHTTIICYFLQFLQKYDSADSLNLFGTVRLLMGLISTRVSSPLSSSLPPNDFFVFLLGFFCFRFLCSFLFFLLLSFLLYLLFSLFFFQSFYETVHGVQH